MLKFEQKIEILANKSKKTMGIEAYVLDRAERVGEKRGIKAKPVAFVKTLFVHTDFDDTKIALLAGVSVEMVQKLRNS